MPDYVFPDNASVPTLSTDPEQDQIIAILQHVAYYTGFRARELRLDSFPHRGFDRVYLRNSADYYVCTVKPA